MSDFLAVRTFQRLIRVLLENQVERESLESMLQARGAIDSTQLEAMRTAIRSQMTTELAGLETVDTIEKLDYYLERFSSLRVGPK